MRGSQAWNSGVEALTRFDRRARHWQASHVVVWSAANGIGLGLFFVYSMHSIDGLTFASVTYGALFGLAFFGQSLFLWRPGGMARRRYERWCARLAEPGVVMIPAGVPAAGWYGNPARGGRIAYWTGREWA